MKKSFALIALSAYAVGSLTMGWRSEQLQKEPDLESLMPQALWKITEDYLDFMPGPVFKKHNDQIVVVKFNFSGDKIISTSEDGNAFIWNTKDGKSMYSLKAKGLDWRTLFGISTPVYFSAAEFSLDGRSVVTERSPDHQVSLWNAMTGTLQRTLPSIKNHYPQDLYRKPQFNRSGTRLLVTADYAVFIWNIADKDGGVRVLPYSGPEDRILWAQFTPLDATIAVLGKDGQSMFIDFWNIEHNKRIKRINLKNTNNYTSSVFSRDGRKMALIDDFAVNIFDITTGEWRGGRKTPPDEYIVAISSDLNKMLVLTRRGNALDVVDINTGQLLCVLQGHTRAVKNAQFGAHDTIIVTTGEDYTVRIWDTQTGEELQQFPGSAVQINRDGSMIAVWDASGVDNNIYLWSKSLSFKKTKIEKAKAPDAKDDAASQARAEALLKRIKSTIPASLGKDELIMIRIRELIDKKLNDAAIEDRIKQELQKTK